MDKLKQNYKEAFGDTNTDIHKDKGTDTDKELDTNIYTATSTATATSRQRHTYIKAYGLTHTS